MFANAAKRQEMLLRGFCEHLFVTITDYNSAHVRGGAKYLYSSIYSDTLYWQ